MNYAEESLRLHGEWQGKIEVVSRVPVKTKDDLSLAYTPGVAQPCLEIQKDYDKSFTLTRRHNLVAVITDGTAVLGLGDIGPEAGMPVMEGKCALFKAFGAVDAFPICIRSKDVDEIVRTIYLISGSFGGINLEDIAAPRCFEIERRLKELCDIPVFHDDQHGTAVVVGAALINALKVVKKDIGEAKVVINGAGSAGIAIGKHLLNLGVKHLKMVDRFGILCEGEQMNPAQEEMAGSLRGQTAPDLTDAGPSLPSSDLSPRRVPLPDRTFAADRIKTRTLGRDGFSIDRSTVDLRYVEQIVDPEQSAALAQCLLYAGRHLMDGKRTVSKSYGRSRAPGWS